MRKIFTIIISAIATVVLSTAAFAQTSSFVYQGKLDDSGVPANGTYQFQFKLYDAAAAGGQIGPTLTDVPATVSNGIFAVNLDFGTASFSGPPRFLEIAVRMSGTGQAYTLLNPRQPVTSTPYAVKSLNADAANTATTANNSNNLGGVPAAQYVITSDPRMTDARDPLPSSGYYIQNSQNPQATSNFNISGEGKAAKLTAVAVNATSEFQQGGARVLHFNNVKSGFIGLFQSANSTGQDNMFVGYEAGKTNTTGNFNAFLGSQSGKNNGTGFNNSFFGAYSGHGNTTGTNNAYFGVNAGLGSNGSFNAFFGANAGFTNFTGADNSFFGSSAGVENTTGSGNSFFGRSAGKSVEVAGNNSFFGAYAGENTTTGGNAFFGAFAGQKNNAGFANTFIGFSAGKEITGGSQNTYIGWGAGQNQGAVGNNNVAIGYNAKVGLNVTNAIAIGANSFAASSNAVALGNASSVVSIEGSLEVSGPGKFESMQVTGNSSLGVVTGTSLNIGGGRLVVPSSNNPVSISGSLEVGSSVSGNSAFFSSGIDGYSLTLKSLSGGGSNIPLCYYDTQPGTPLSQKNLAHCSSSQRYKDNIQDFTSGLSLVQRLRPVTFDWKSNGLADVGFVAEEVAAAEPLLASYVGGQVQGVKYAQITTALVNAVKEQQTQIQKLESQITELKAIACAANPTASICRGGEQK